MTRLVLLASVLLAAPAAAQDSLGIGADLPLATQSVTTADGASLSLGAARGDAGLTVLFWSDACPWVDKYAERVATLADDYGRAGVGFVLIYPEAPSPEDAPATTPNAPVVVDTDRAFVQAFAVKNTPQAFFFGPDGTLAYQGAIDDSPASVDRVQVPYLQQAMDQSIAGVPIEVQSTRALGCTIRAAGS